MLATSITRTKSYFDSTPPSTYVPSRSNGSDGSSVMEVIAAQFAAKALKQQFKVD